MPLDKSCLSSLNNSIEEHNCSRGPRRKNKLPLSEDAVAGLDNNHLLGAIKECDNSIRFCQYEIWRSQENKQLLLSEFEKRTSEIVNLKGDQIGLLSEFIVFNNELIKTFVDVYENNFSDLLTVADQVSRHLETMNNMKSNIETRENMENNSILCSMTDQLERGRILKESLFEILSKNYATEMSHTFENYHIEQLLFDRDDASEENQILKRTIYQQTHLITQLSAENQRLLKLAASAKSGSSPAVISESLYNGTEPLRNVCNRYQQEMRRSVKNLENLIKFAKSDSISCVTLDDHSKLTADELMDMVKKCDESLDVIKTLYHQSHSIQMVNHVKKLQENIETIRNRIDLMLAKISGNESRV
ncbi:hypothetical protein RF11_00513 [Thelohanellus kitauei]|uniref:Uncharacterized protein n=1 Tax=Thelohanellus kitauei TaxID=669202 RepID=A0A0C2MXP5_THEKT|nr:hypothetical protein RF11_00513 [Thelohanellus kitauei]